jgi:hypothetical protein
MTSKEAKEKSLWYQLSPRLRKMITDTVETGGEYLTLPDGEHLNLDEQYSLQELGYYIYFNKAFNSHEIRW